MFREDLRTHPFPLLLVAVLLVANFLGLGSVPLTDVDEAVFAEASREMLERGDWVTPTYNYEPRYDKPILFYWLQGISFTALGVNEYAARLPSACAALVLTLALYFFSREYLSPRAAVWATVAWAVSVQTFAYGRAGVTDMILCLFIFGSTSALFIYLQDTRRRVWLRLGYACAALGFLTKGLIGVVFPGVIVVLYVLVQRTLRLRDCLDPWGVLLFMGIAFPWYIAETVRDGGAFFKVFFLKHHLERYTDVVSGHRGPWFYFLGVLAVGFYPWVGFVPAGLFAGFRSRADELARFAGIWFSFVFMFFSFSGTKLPNYLLSALPAGSILAGIGIDSLLDRGGKAAPRFAGGIILFIGLVLVGGAAYLGRTVSNSEYPVGGILVVFVLLSLIVVWAATVIVRGRLGGLGIPSGAMAGALAAIALFVLPVVVEVLQGDLKTFAVETRAAGRVDEGRLVTFRLNRPSLLFYYGGRVEKFGEIRDLRNYVRNVPDARIVAKVDSDVTALLLDGGFRLHRRGTIYNLFAPGEGG